MYRYSFIIFSHIYAPVLINLLYLCNNTTNIMAKALTCIITNHTLYRRYETGNCYFWKS